MPEYLSGRNLTVTVTFSFAFEISGFSMAWVGGLGLADVTGETESLGAGLDDVVDDGVAGLPAGLTGGVSAGDFRDRNGETEEEDLWDLELVPNIVCRERERELEAHAGQGHDERESVPPTKSFTHALPPKPALLCFTILCFFEFCNAPFFVFSMHVICPKHP